MKIFLDPGHGGSDPGACANGIVEKDINLTVALKLKELLINEGIEVMLSRESDIGLGLTERCQLANNWEADFFISVHHNAGGGDGYEVIHSIHYGKGYELALFIGRYFDETGQNLRRIFARAGKTSADYYTVIAGTNMSAIITEYAFLDSKDVSAVNSTEKLHSEAWAIFKGICAFLGIDVKKSHWAEPAYNYINSHGIHINETRFDDPITRGEYFAVLAQSLGWKP